MMNLERFISAQKNNYEIALKEIKNGHKETHWMWYIFPQIKGLGSSPTAIYYEIKNENEAKAYLKNEILRLHLFEISNTLLNLKSNNAYEIFGYPDNLKLKSSMTLFDYIEPNSIFKKVLNKFYDGQLDEMTLTLLKYYK